MPSFEPLVTADSTCHFCDQEATRVAVFTRRPGETYTICCCNVPECGERAQHMVEFGHDMVCDDRHTYGFDDIDEAV